MSEDSAYGEVVLTTERLVLRRFTADNVELLVELDSDPAVMRYITGGVPTPRAEIADDVLPCWLGHYAQYDGYGFWAALDRSTGEFLGWFHLRPAEAGAVAEPELGYRLRRAAWGLGYAAEGTRALIALAFTRLGAERVFAETMAVNLASRRVMEKSGLSLVRHFRAPRPYPIEGEEEGDVEYALAKADWLAHREA